MIKHYRKGKIIAAIILCVALTMTGCGMPGKKAPEEVQDTRIMVKTSKPTTNNISIDGEFIGKVEAATEVMVMVKSAGDVTSTNFEIGDRVEAGDLMFTIDDEAAQLTMASSRIQASNAQVGIATAESSNVVAEKNLANTQDNIRSNLGTISTNIKKMRDAIADAKNTLAKGNLSEDYAKEDLRRALETLHDAESDIDDYSDDKHAINEKISKLKDQLASETNPTEQARLQSEISSKQAELQTLKATKEALEDSLDDLEFAAFSKAISEKSAEYAVESYQRMLEQAELALSDYEKYSIPATNSAAESQLTSANSAKIQSEAGIITARNSVENAQIAVEQAQMALDNTKGIAPVSGLITSKGITLDNSASLGTVAYTISSDDDLNIVFYVAENVMNNISVGQTITVERNRNSYEAVISENTGVIDASTGLFKVKAALKDGINEMLAGTSVKIIMSTEHADHVLSIPTDAIYYQDQKPYIYISNNGIAERRDIEIGLSSEELTQVISGIDANDDVITSWASQLREGSEVKTSDSAPMTKTEGTETSKLAEGIKSEINIFDDGTMSACEE